MKIFSIVTALAATAVSLFQAVHAEPCAFLAANKQKAHALLDDVFNEKDVSAVDKYIGTTYLQHNPLVKDGPQSLKDFATLFTNETKVEFGAMVAEGDLVWVNARYTGLPNTPVMVGVDVFRFENDKIVEHWDMLQTEVPASQTASGRAMFPVQGVVAAQAPASGPASCTDGCETSDPRLVGHKQSARALLDDLFNKKDISAVDRYIGTTYLQHNPLVPDGPQPLRDFAASFTNETSVQFGAIAADGDLVWVNTRYTGLPGTPTVVGVDVFRFENNKIVEHWDMLQTEVPASQTASGRPMFPVQG